MSCLSYSSNPGLEIGGAHISEEFGLLLGCARAETDDIDAHRISTLCQKKLDWDYILGKAYWHSLAPLTYKALMRICPESIPETVKLQLKDQYMSVARRNMLLSTKLLDVLEVLERAGIVAVPYKGPTLASNVYGDLCLRKFNDLDIVVREGEVEVAKAALLACGFQWVPFKRQKVGDDEGSNVRYWHEYNFVKEGYGTSVDLHWRISSRRFPFNFDLDALWPRLEKGSLLGRAVSQFPAEEMLLFLCVHGCKDLWWKRLVWVCDVAEIIRKNTDLHWDRIVVQAEMLGASRMLLLGLALSGDLLDAPLPDKLRDRIVHDAAVINLAKLVKSRLFESPTLLGKVFPKPIFRMKVRERFYDKLPSCVTLAQAVQNEFVKRYKTDLWGARSNRL